MTLRIGITPGEPAGIGPDLVVQLAQQDWPVELVVCADAELLKSRAHHLGLPLTIRFAPETTSSLLRSILLGQIIFGQALRVLLPRFTTRLFPTSAP